jgi:hypothetical protein
MPMNEAITLDYKELENEAIRGLEADRIWVLATSAADRVTARSISTINDGLFVWFQTGDEMTKWSQMAANNRVALCRANIQIEGIAELRGGCDESGNEWFLAEYPKVHGGSFAAYGRLPSEKIVRVAPLSVSFWKYIEGKPCRDYLDVQAKRARREWVILPDSK